MKIEKFKVLLYLKKQEWTRMKSSPDGTRRRERDYGAVLWSLALRSALESSSASRLRGQEEC